MTDIVVALVQERNQGDAEANLAVIETRVLEAAAAGAQLVVLQELHNGPYFCQRESVDEFDLAEPIPGPSSERLGRLAAQAGVVLVASLFERRAPVTARCTSPTIPATTRSSISHRAISVSSRSIPRLVVWAYWCAGTSGIRKRRA